MRPSDSSAAGPSRLFGRCRTFATRFFQTVSRKAMLLAERTADGVKDAILDLGCNAAEDGSEASEPLPLPPLDPGAFVESLRNPVEDALRQMAALVNTGPGASSAQTEQQVRALFEGLAAEAIEQAFRLRMTAAEADLPPEGAGADWARKYRRMMAREGRWPMPPDSNSG